MAKEDAIWVLGCMSGTSMDGVDAAMILTDGVDVFEFGATGFRPYAPEERAVISAAQGLWPGEAGVRAASTVVEAAHADLIKRFEGVELVGFHGQTLAHEPAQARSHQAGDGAALARACGHEVAWDFRSADIAAGGQGAPLAPFYHFALAKRLDQGRVGFLNLGGVGNITIVDPNAELPEAKGALLAFDTGPANALLDDFIFTRTGLACDYGGAMAAAGIVQHAVVDWFLGQEYFPQNPPKSLDRNQFSSLAAAVSDLNDLDGAATLSACSVAAVKAGFAHISTPPSRVLVCGGGRKNLHMLTSLQAALPLPVLDIDNVGFDGDMIEAQAFAYLAARVHRKLPLSAPMTTGVPQPLAGGRLSSPN